LHILPGLPAVAKPGPASSEARGEDTGSLHAVCVLPEREVDCRMFTASLPASDSKPVFYQALAGQLDLLLAGESDAIANLANAAALIFQAVPDLNWAGFYLLKGGELVLGPFQGAPACIRIALDKGVCGAAASSRESIVVPDVNAFPGHIVCDAASRSELVVPLLQDSRLLGVLDLDSPSLARFDAEDRAGMEQFVSVLLQHISLPAA
jgi:GAF domain-containing protein